MSSPKVWWVRAEIPPIKYMPVLVRYQTRKGLTTSPHAPKHQIYQIAIWNGEEYIFPNARQPLVSKNVIQWAKVPE